MADDTKATPPIPKAPKPTASAQQQPPVETPQDPTDLPVREVVLKGLAKLEEIVKGRTNFHLLQSRDITDIDDQFMNLLRVENLPDIYIEVWAAARWADGGYTEQYLKDLGFVNVTSEMVSPHYSTTALFIPSGYEVDDKGFVHKGESYLLIGSRHKMQEYQRGLIEKKAVRVAKRGDKLNNKVELGKGIEVTEAKSARIGVPLSYNPLQSE